MRLGVPHRHDGDGYPRRPVLDRGCEDGLRGVPHCLFVSRPDLLHWFPPTGATPISESVQTIPQEEVS